VAIVGNLSGQIGKPGSGIDSTQGQVTGLGAAMYVLGACLGALFFGWLTDRFGRKKLFMITLGTYLAATALTALSFAPWWFFLFRFLTGFGIGGEYAAINSAIDELIPSRHRGRVDIVINGTYWAGAAVGALLTVPATNDLPADVGWRICFALGVVLGAVVLGTGPVGRAPARPGPAILLDHGRRPGSYDQALDARLRAADTVVVLNFAFPRCAWRSLRRGHEPGEYWRWVWAYRRRITPDSRRRFGYTPR
jgi:MFS family permease